MSIVTTPTYPAAGDEVSLSLTSATGTDVAWSVTRVPTNSSLATGLLKLPGATAASPVALAEESRNAFSFTPDVAGTYDVTGYDIKRYVGLSAFAGDAFAGARFELKATQSATIYVGDALELRIRTVAGEGATLVMKVANDTIRSATLEDFASERSRIASLKSATLSALGALVDVATSSAGNALSSDISELRSKYEAHRANGGGTYHRNTTPIANPDTVNVVTRYAPASNTDAIASINEIYDRLLGHMIATTAISGAARWHKDIDDTLSDFSVVPKAFDEASATVLSAWIRQIYREHIPRITYTAQEIHNTADTTNTVAAATPIESLILSFIKDIKTTTIGAVTGVNTGSIRLTNLQGFKIRTS